MKSVKELFAEAENSPMYKFAENMLDVTEALFAVCQQKGLCHESGKLDYSRLSALTGMNPRHLKQIFTLNEKSRVYDLFVLVQSLGKRLRLVLED